MRANSLQDRIDRLAVKVTQLDSGEEEGQCQSVRVFSPGSSVSVPNVCCGSVSLRVINLRKAFRSSTLQDQQLLSNGSMTDAVADLYNSSDRPPPLNALTVYRYHTHQQGSPIRSGRVDRYKQPFTPKVMFLKPGVRPQNVGRVFFICPAPGKMH